MKPRSLSLTLLFSLIALTPVVAGAAAISVTNGAALEGAFGMQIDYNGTTQQVFVEDWTPDTEPTYNFEFRHNFNNVFMPAESTQFVMLVRSEAPASNEIRVYMWCRTNACGAGGAGGQFNLTFQVRKDTGEPGGPWRHCARISAGPNANAHFRVEVVQGTGVNDGTCRVYRNGALLADINNIPNDEMDIDTHRWGGLAAVNTAISGFTKNDSFVSTR